MYSEGLFCSNTVTPDYTNPIDNSPYPECLGECPGAYAESSTINTFYGRGSNTNYRMTSTPGWSSYDTTPFGALGDINTAFVAPRPSTNYASMRSPESTFSRASSESVQQSAPSSSLKASSRASSPRKSRSPYLHASYLHSDNDIHSSVASRKNGRTVRHTTSSASAEEASQLHSPQRTSCVPHKQIERKYREGLNMEFERLRRAVPTLPQCTDANVIGATKPSKGMVLAAAIEYIGRIEGERDAALDEIERLGGTCRTSKLNASQADRRMF